MKKLQRYILSRNVNRLTAVGTVENIGSAIEVFILAVKIGRTDYISIFDVFKQEIFCVQLVCAVVSPDGISAAFLFLAERMGSVSG